MLWKLINLKRFWARSAGWLACFLVLLPSSGSAETYTSYSARLESIWTNSVPIWCWSQVPAPQTYWNAGFECQVSYSDTRANYFESCSPIGTFYQNQLWNMPIFGSIASNFPSRGSIFTFNSPIHKEVYKPIGIFDPSFPVGSCIPMGTTGYSEPSEVLDSSGRSSIVWGRTNVFSTTLLAGRAYILPQRIFVTNGWFSGTNSLLWDMYGDGRMFLPRLVCECGFLSLQNVVDFDPSLWAQLHFRGEYTRTKQVDCSPFYRLSLGPDSGYRDVLWFDGVTRPFSDNSLHLTVTVTNQNLFGTNMLSPEQFPFMWELLGFSAPPSFSSDNTWKYMRYIPESIQFGDFGVAVRSVLPTNLTPSQITEIGKRGIRGLCFAPVNRLNGATLKFQRFVYQPLLSLAGGFQGRIYFYLPSGLAWDSDGGCCFNWSKDGKPFSYLFKWPLTASWDFNFAIDTFTNGSMVSANSFTITNINSRIPIRGPTGPDNAPPIPAPPRGGTSSGGHGNTFTPLHPYGDDFTFTSGIILGGTSTAGGSGGRDTPISSTSLSYQNTENGLPVDDSGDLQGDYNITLPTYADFYTWDDFEDRNSLSFHLSYTLADNMSFALDDALFDFAPAGLPSGQFGEALQNSGLGQLDTSSGNAPAQEGFYELFDTSGQWFYERLNLETMLPSQDTLVLPWPELTEQGWDWSLTREFTIPENFATWRPLLLWAVGIGLSLLFLACVMSLFSGGK